MKMKKIIATVLALVLVAGISIGGTVAYLTDTEKAENTFTVGNVDITLYESKLHRDNDSATDDQIIADAATYQDYLAEAGKNMVPGRWINKVPYIKNTGANDAYVRVKLTVEDDFLDYTEMMLYTTAMNNGVITRPAGPVDNGDGTVTYTFTYLQPLEAGKMTYYAPFWRIRIAPEMDNVDLANLTMDKIVVTAEAIQSEGFADAAAAFAAYDAQKTSGI